MDPQETETDQSEPLPSLAAEPDLEAERQARIDYYKNIVPKRKKHPWLKLLAVLVVLAVLGGGGFAFYWHRTTNKPAAKSSTIATHQAQSQADSAANQKVATTAYSSTNFAVGINYPQGWTVSDQPTDLSVTSPVVQLTDASGATDSAKIVMNMVPKGTLPAAFGSSATAVLNSIDVNYTQPTASQRASTYLTFAQYQASTISGSLDAIYVSGNYGYQKDQNIPSTDIDNVDPLITVSFEKCPNTTCTTGLTPLTIKASDWSASSLSDPIKTLLTSLAFN